MKQRPQPTIKGKKEISDPSQEKNEVKTTSASTFSETASPHNLADISIHSSSEENEGWETVKGKKTLREEKAQERREEKKQQSIAKRNEMAENNGYLPDDARQAKQELTGIKSQQGNLREDYDPDFTTADYKIAYKPKDSRKRDQLGRKDALIGKDILTANSGQAAAKGNIDMPAERVFTTKEVGHSRKFDSEVKILETLRQKIDAFCKDKGLEQEDINFIKGYVKITSSFPTCDSCKGVIEQFKKRYPGIEVTAQKAM